MLAHLVEYSVDKNGFMGGPGQTAPRGHRHWSHLIAMYPYYVVNWDQLAWRDTMEQSWSYWAWDEVPNSWSHAVMCSMAASMGKSEPALHHLNLALDGPNIAANTMHTEDGNHSHPRHSSHAGNLVVERAPLSGALAITVMANTGHLTFNDSQPWTGSSDTYTVVDNAGQLDVNYNVNATYFSNNGYVQGLVHTLNILANSGVINLQDTVNPAVVNPGGVGLIDAQMNVGNSGSLANVHGVINLSGSNGHLGLTLDDRTDTGSDLPWAIDADNTTIGDLTVNYVLVNSVPDYSSSYQAFSNPGSAVAVFGNPPFFGLFLNGTQFPAWSLGGPAVLSNQKGDVVSIPPSVGAYAGLIGAYAASDLPPGLSIDPTTGVISGVVDEQASLGVYHTLLTASNISSGFVRSKRIDWHITQIALDVPPLYLNYVGESVNLLVGATSPSTAAITFSATNLPDGLSIDPCDGPNRAEPWGGRSVPNLRYDDHGHARQRRFRQVLPVDGFARGRRAGLYRRCHPRPDQF